MKSYLETFIEVQTNYLLKELKDSTGLTYDQVIVQHLKNSTCAHVTFSFSDAGINKPTRLQLDIQGSYTTGKISLKLIYMDLMFDSMSTIQLQKLADCLYGIEVHLNELYDQKRMKR